MPNRFPRPLAQHVILQWKACKWRQEGQEVRKCLEVTLLPRHTYGSKSKAPRLSWITIIYSDTVIFFSSLWSVFANSNSIYWYHFPKNLRLPTVGCESCAQPTGLVLAAFHLEMPARVTAAMLISTVVCLWKRWKYTQTLLNLSNTKTSF